MSSIKTCARKNNNFILKKASKINFTSISNNQMISTGTSLIPFVEHDDANRALMGSNMQKQAVPLMHKEIAKIQTGIEKIIGKNSEYTIISKTCGLIKYSSNKKIIVYDKISFEKEYFSHLNKNTKKKIKIKISKGILPLKFSNYHKRIYKLKNLNKSNQNTQITQIRLGKKKDWIKKNQVLSDSNGIKNGILAVGKNLLLGYMCWEGYNFEDAIVINERLINEDILTSLHVKKYKTFIIKNGDEDVWTIFFRFKTKLN